MEFILPELGEIVALKNIVLMKWKHWSSHEKWERALLEIVLTSVKKE